MIWEGMEEFLLKFLLEFIFEINLYFPRIESVQRIHQRSRRNSLMPHPQLAS